MTQPLQYGFQGNQLYNQYYKHSGKVTLAGPALGLIVGLPAAVALGFVYAYIDLYSPIVYLNVLLCMAFGAALGAVPGVVMRAGKVRNVPVALAVVAVVVLAGYYTCWIAWVCAVFDRYAERPRDFTQLDLALSPRALVDIVSALNEQGTWSIGHSYSSSSSSSNHNSNVSGIALGLVWLVEAGMIVTFAYLAARHFAAGLPFCEVCDRWCEKAVVLARLAPGDAEQTRRSMEAGDFGYLAHLRSAAGAAGTGAHWWQVEHHRCPKCDKLHVVTVNDVVLSVDRRGKQTQKKRPVVNRLVVAAEQMPGLRAAMAAPQMPPAYGMMGGLPPVGR